MIKITKNTGTSRKVLTVTQGAYENIYRKLGYVPFKREDWIEGGKNSAPPKTGDELFRESVEAKPISQWKADELKRYAALVGIDPKQKAADLKEAIKAAISANVDAGTGKNTAPPKTDDDSDADTTDDEDTDDGTD